MEKEFILKTIFNIESFNFSTINYQLNQEQKDLLEMCYKKLGRELTKEEIFDIVELRKQKMLEYYGKIKTRELNIALFPLSFSYKEYK